MNIRDSYKYYVDKDFSILPCGRDKKPLVSTWAELQERRPTLEELKTWAEAYPEANIALVCGRTSDLTVVDCDSIEAVALVENRIPDTLEVPTATTPRGGKHYYFRYSSDLHSRNGVATDIDIKSEGGYVLAPGSRTDKGTYVLGPIDIDERTVIPDRLLNFLKEKESTSTPVAQGTPLTQGRRDEDLFHASFQLFNDGLPREQIDRIVLAMAKVADPPFPEREAKAYIESAWKRYQARCSGGEKGDTLAECDASAVRIRPIPRLWPGVIPTHMTTAITGDPGEGKSLVAIDMATRVSRGLPFPVYDKSAPPVIGRVFYVTSEGVPEMILVPRLIAAGADLDKVKIIEGILQEDGDFSMFDITTNLPLLVQRAREFADLKMIVIDPIASFIPDRINTNQQNMVRQMMDKLSDLARKLGIAVVVVMHFAKVAGVKAKHKTSGSVQFSAAVIMSWSVIRREGDPRNVRLLVPQKSNITGGYKSLSFGIHRIEFPAPDNPNEMITTAKIEYGALVDEDPETLISPPQESDSHVAKAREFLTRKLREGTTLYAFEIINEAEENGIPKWALYKAKERMDVQHDKEGQFQGKTFWYLPKREDS